MSTSIAIDRVHQIFINDSGRLPETIPHQLSINIDSVHENYKRISYNLWGGEELEAFIDSKLGREVLDAYLALKPYSYRSDLARFCLLFVFGGLYVDLGVRVLRPWEIPSHKGIAAFRDIGFISESWTALQTGLLWSTPGRSEFQLAIENIIKNVKNRYYGKNPLYPTGPVTLGRAFVCAMVSKGQSEDVDDQHIGQCRALTSDADPINLCYVTKHGSFIAMRNKSRDGDLTSLGLVGVNDYNAIWRSRNVYGESVRKWTFRDPLIRRHTSVQKTGQGLIIQPGTTEIAVFGPYVDLPAGMFDVTLCLAAHGQTAEALVEITSECGVSIIRTDQIEVENVEFTPHKRTLILWQPASAIEIRILNHSKSHIGLSEYSISEKMSSLWQFDSPKIHYRNMACGVGSAPIESDMADPLVYGPYVNLSAGDYCVHALFSSETTLKNPYLEIVGDAAQTIIGISTWECLLADTSDGLRVEFNLDSDACDVEFRLGWQSGSAGEFLGYALYKSS